MSLRERAELKVRQEEMREKQRRGSIDVSDQEGPGGILKKGNGQAIIRDGNNVRIRDDDGINDDDETGELDESFAR